MCVYGVHDISARASRYSFEYAELHVQNQCHTTFSQLILGQSGYRAMHEYHIRA